MPVGLNSDEPDGEDNGQDDGGEGEEADTDDPGVEESFALLCEFEVLGEDASSNKALALESSTSFLRFNSSSSLAFSAA